MKFTHQLKQFIRALSPRRFAQSAAAFAILMLACTGQAKAYNWLPTPDEYIYENGFKYDFLNDTWYDGDHNVLSFSAYPGNSIEVDNITYEKTSDYDNYLQLGGDLWSDVDYVQDSETGDWYYWVYAAGSGWMPCAGYNSEHFLYFSSYWLYGVTSGTYFNLNGATGGWGGPDGTHPSSWDREGEYPNNGPDSDSSAVLLDGDGWETIVVDNVSYEYDAFTDIWYLYDSESGGYIDVADPNS